jgi:hypothetical protein
MGRFLLWRRVLLVIQAFLSMEEAIDDASRMQQIRRPGERFEARASGRRYGIGFILTPVVEVRPARRDERFRPVGQDEIQMKNSSSTEVAPERQCLTFERVLGTKDGYL